MSRDPIGLVAGPNLYGYVGNSPVNFYDPLGLDRSWFDQTLFDLGDAGVFKAVGGFGLGLLDNIPLWVGIPGSPTLGDVVSATGAAGCSSSGGRAAGGLVGAIALGAAGGGSPFDAAKAKRALFLTHEKSLGSPAQRAVEALARFGRGELEIPKGLTSEHLLSYRAQAVDAISKTTGTSAEAATRAVQEPRIGLIDAILASGGP